MYAPPKLMETDESMLWDLGRGQAFSTLIYYLININSKLIGGAKEFCF